MSDASDSEARLRWRLILGPESSGCLGAALSGTDARRDRALTFLYKREYGHGRNVRQRACTEGGLEDSQLSIPDWINEVQQLFPKETIERLEKDALERYQLKELVTNPEVLKRAEPSMTLLKAVLQTKHLMNQEVLAIARELVRKVVAQLVLRTSAEVTSSFGGRLRRPKSSRIKIAKNFDPKTTIRRNLEHYSRERGQLIIKTPYFVSRTRHHESRWKIIILVDQSGSMVENVIHAAVTAAIFFSLPAIRTHLCAFDTSVVDLSDCCSDPVETLLKVQLGGGTDIAQALRYAETLVEAPRRSIVVLISDFFEGAPENAFLSSARRLLDSGVTLLGLAALDPQAVPHYNHDLAQALVDMGAKVGAMTPGELAGWIGEKLGAS